MRLQYEESTPLGSTRITLAVEHGGMDYEAGPPVNQALQIPWSSVTRAGTAVLDLSAASAAFPGKIAAQMRRREMLVMAYRENGGPNKEVSIPLPVGIPRDALVADVRSFLGPRWAGEAMPYAKVPGRLGTGGARRTLLVFALIAGVLVCLLLALLAGAFLMALLLNEYMVCLYAFAGGAWLFRRGFMEYRNRLAVSGTPTAKANSAAIGLSELSGRARGAHPSLSPISGTPCVYWQAEIRQWVKGGDGKGHWQTHFKRESAPLDTVELEDETGRVLVWCQGAEVILQTQRWRSNHEAEVPAQAQALLASVGKGWPPRSDSNHMHLTERRLEEGGPLYVMGTLAESWRVQAAAGVPSGGPASPTERPVPMSRPGSLSAVPALAWAMLKRQVRKEVRGRASSPPALDPQRVLVWKGDQGRPFIIADRTEHDTIKSLHRRMWIFLMVGAGLMAGALYYALDAILN